MSATTKRRAAAITGAVRLGLALIAALVVGACSAPADSAETRQEIAAVVEGFVEAVQAGDTARVGALAPDLDGSSESVAHLQRLLSSTTIEVDAEDVTVERSRATALLEITRDDGDGASITVPLSWSDDEWRIEGAIKREERFDIVPLNPEDAPQ